MKSEQKESPRAKLEHLYSKMFFSGESQGQECEQGAWPHRRVKQTGSEGRQGRETACKILSHHPASFLSSDNCVFHATGSELIACVCPGLTHVEVESFAFPNICFCLHRFSLYLVNRTKNSLSFHINCLCFLKVPVYNWLVFIHCSTWNLMAAFSLFSSMEHLSL